ncbi:MAG: UDP-glucose/GDP-mannose dehydrogenase family protein [Chthonomonas sp.]|nr:UDP-glucose/GDP-mannose dehydrogenase family protein [Chthonomonas sp.]
MRIAVIGTGYVGLVTGVALADLGNEVICVDNNPDKVALIQSGRSPIYEPGIEEFITRNLEEGRLSVTQDAAEATRQSDIVFIAVGTPPSADGSPDITAVVAAAKEVAKGIGKYTLVVNKSTVPVGSGEMVADLLRDAGVDDSLFDVVSNPEFLREGSAIWDTMNPDRIIIGAKNREAASRLIELYQPLDKPVLVTDLQSAELIKYASNCFLALKISFINALSRLCEACDGNVGDVAKGIGLDHRIGSAFLGAGLGWGGSCLPKDTAGMIRVAEAMGYDFRLLKEVVAINDEQPRHFIDRLEERLGGLQGKTIAMLGLAFKPNTDDIRDAKSLLIAEDIISRGGKVRGYDPVAMPNVASLRTQIELADNAYACADGADAILLVTEWNEFKQLDFAKLGALLKNKVLFDGRRIYSKDILGKLGFEVFTIGAA